MPRQAKSTYGRAFIANLQWLGVTQQAIANTLNISNRLVNHWATGRRKIANRYLPELQRLNTEALRRRREALGNNLGELKNFLADCQQHLRAIKADFYQDTLYELLEDTLRRLQPYTQMSADKLKVALETGHELIELDERFHGTMRALREAPAVKAQEVVRALESEASMSLE